MEPRGQCTTEVCGPVGLMEPGPGPNIPAVGCDCLCDGDEKEASIVSGWAWLGCGLGKHRLLTLTQ